MKSLETFASILKTSGPFGLLIFFGVVVFLTSASDLQKEEFIDSYFLFKNVSTNPIPFSLVVIGIFFGWGATIYLYTKRLSSRDEEIQRISDERNLLQEKLLNN